ncbi:MAG: hypothetical protein DDT33_00593 [Firmicutes bacterium]|nr:hypothetical protein [Bacillota bacterium]
MENKIRGVLEAKSIKVSDVIRKTGLSKSYFYDVLANNSMPSLVNARKIADALQVNIEDLFPNDTCGL